MPEEQKKDGDDSQSGAAGAADSGKKSEESEEAPKPITFKSQEEFDAVIEARLARAKPKDYDDLVALRDRVKAEEDEKKDEVQKAKDAAKEREDKADAKIAKADAKLIRAEIVAEATAQKAADTSIVVALLAGNDTIEVDDDGEVTGAKEAVKKLLRDKPLLVAGASAGASGGEFGGNDQKTINERIAAAEAAGDWKLARQLKLQTLHRT